MKKVIALVVALYSFSATAEEASHPKEYYMPNEAGGFVVLTAEKCAFEEAIKKGFEYRTYATLSDNTIAEEGCWMRPDISQAPQIQGVTIIPIVNLWYENAILPFAQADFSPDKKRWNVVKKDEI